MQPIHLSESSSNESNNMAKAKRKKEEREFINGLCKINGRISLWVGDEVIWRVRTPFFLRLDARLPLAQSTAIDANAIKTLIKDFRRLKPQTELEFFALMYIRQKPAVPLFIDIILRTASISS